jgi:photosystem II stability/assembly factor-like uncharacterized protein
MRGEFIMVTNVTPAAPAGGKSPTSSWPAYALVLIVLASAVYAFSPRPLPTFSPTLLHFDRVLVNGIAQQGDRIVAVGEQGRILVADSPSGPWHEGKVQPQRGSTLTQVLFVGDGIVMAVGHDGWIIRSADKGETWEEAQFDTEHPDPLLGIAGPYAGRLFAFGGFGQFYFSNDRGKTWQRRTDAAISDHHVNAMTRANDGSLLLVGERGLLLRSTDNGQSWQALPQVYTGSFYGALTLPSGELLVYGMRGNVFVSADTGKTWHKSELPGTVSIFGGTVDAAGNVILVGENQMVLVSRDHGAHFTLAAQGERHNLAAVLALKSGSWLTAGETGITQMQPAAGAKP